MTKSDRTFATSLPETLQHQPSRAVWGFARHRCRGRQRFRCSTGRIFRQQPLMPLYAACSDNDDDRCPKSYGVHAAVIASSWRTVTMVDMSMSQSAQMLLAPPRTHAAAIVRVLLKFGDAALRLVAATDIRIRVLGAHETYQSVSTALQRLEVPAYTWEFPPAGIFVVNERRMYLRSVTPMTIAHEFGHALDCALGAGSYHSTTSASINGYFRDAVTFITPYAAIGTDEYFAESVRAYVSVNDPQSPWPRATRKRLKRVDPRMHHYLQCLFEEHFDLPTVELRVKSSKLNEPNDNEYNRDQQVPA
jgi:hypothetical protein